MLSPGGPYKTRIGPHRHIGASPPKIVFLPRRRIDWRHFSDVLAVCRPIEEADVAVVTADVHDVYKDYARPMCRVDVYRP